MKIELERYPGEYAIVKLDSGVDIKALTEKATFLSFTKTDQELSLVIDMEHAPMGLEQSNNWGLLKIRGPLDFTLVGVLNQVLEPLSANGISIFAISTFDTDYLLIKSDQMDHACQILSADFTIHERMD